MAKRYARTPVADEAAYQKKLEITREYLHLDTQVLDFGCGTGSTAILHAPYVGNILALDISDKMLEIARGKATGIENLTFKQSSIDEFQGHENSFDVVLGMSILHLLKDKEAVMTKVYKLLKPGGVFVSSTVCLGSSNWVLKLILPLVAKVGLLPLIRFFTPDELSQSLSDAGFKIVHDWRPDAEKVAFFVAQKPL